MIMMKSFFHIIKHKVAYATFYSPMYGVYCFKNIFYAKKVQVIVVSLLLKRLVWFGYVK